MADDRSLVDQALDLFVYAPAGLAISAIEELPSIIDKGRERLGGKIANARILGTFAISRGQRQAGRMVSDAAARLLGQDSPVGGGKRDAGTAAPEAPARARPGSGRNGAGERQLAGDGTGAGVSAASDDRGGPEIPPASALAIPGYDSLSASHVVKRLAGLTPDELDAVRRYEASSRRRKTILHRVAQLQAGRAP